MQILFRYSKVIWESIITEITGKGGWEEEKEAASEGTKHFKYILKVDSKCNQAIYRKRKKIFMFFGVLIRIT